MHVMKEAQLLAVLSFCRAPPTALILSQDTHSPTTITMFGFQVDHCPSLNLKMFSFRHKQYVHVKSAHKNESYPQFDSRDVFYFDSIGREECLEFL